MVNQSEWLHSYPTLSLVEYYSRVTEYTLHRKCTMQKSHKPSWCYILQVSPREAERREKSQGLSSVNYGWQSQPQLLTLGQHVVYLFSSTKAFSVRTRSLSFWRQVLNAAPIRPWIKRTSALMGWLRGKRVLKRSRISALLLRQATQHSLWRALTGWGDTNFINAGLLRNPGDVTRTEHIHCSFRERRHT